MKHNEKFTNIRSLIKKENYSQDELQALLYVIIKDSGYNIVFEKDFSNIQIFAREFQIAFKKSMSFSKVRIHSNDSCADEYEIDLITYDSGPTFTGKGNSKKAAKLAAIYQANSVYRLI